MLRNGISCYARGHIWRWYIKDKDDDEVYVDLNTTHEGGTGI
jgi:hypothetical protein